MNVKDAILRSLDNTAPIEKHSDLGLFFFAKHWFGDTFSLPFGVIHYKMANALFRLYDNKLNNRLERQTFNLVHRGAAKTTMASFLNPLYNIMLKGLTAHARIYKDGWEGGTGVNNWEIIDYPIGEDFMVIISETSASAENFVSNIRTIIDTRTDLIPIFGDKHASSLELDQDMLRRGEQMWRKNAFVTSDSTIVYGIGSGQQIRGRNVMGRRPTLVMIDDMYSERNTKTVETRQKLDTWFYAAMKNSVDIRKGKVVLLGTMVHPDTVFKDVRHSDLWHGNEIPLISEEELEIALSYCNKKGMYLEIPSKERCAILEPQFKSLSWREQYSLHSILSLYKESYEKGKETYFYQEYLNVIRRDAERSIPKDTFKEVDMRITDRRGQKVILVNMEGREWEAVCQMYAGVDLASSSKASSDDTSIVIVGIGRFQSMKPGTAEYEYKTMPYIYEIVGGKLGIFTVEAHESPDGKYRMGWINELARLCQTLPIEIATIEIGGQTETIYNQAYVYFSQKSIHVSLKPETPTNTMRKEERIMNILLPVAQKYHNILVNTNIGKKDVFYSQLEFLGSDGIHDDYPDAAAYAFLYAREPMQSILDRPKSRVEQQNRLQIDTWEIM